MKGAERKIRKLLETKEGLSMGEASGTLLTLVVAIIVATVGTLVIQSINDGQTVNGYAFNVSESGLKAYRNFGDLLPTTKQ